MAFEGGAIPLIGVASSAVTTNAINTSVNVGLSSVLGESISRDIGLDLTAGQDILKSQISPFLTSTLTQSLNQVVSNSLGGLGPAAPVLSQVFGQATTALGLNFLGGLGGGSGVWEGVSEPTQQWPGAGGDTETPANYGGSAFSTGSGGPDVVFSIQPANQGPQLTGSPLGGSGNSAGGGSTPVTLPITNYTTEVPSSAGGAFNAGFTAKAESMGFDVWDDAVIEGVRGVDYNTKWGLRVDPSVTTGLDEGNLF